MLMGWLAGARWKCLQSAWRTSVVLRILRAGWPIYLMSRVVPWILLSSFPSSLSSSTSLFLLPAPIECTCCVACPRIQWGCNGWPNGLMGQESACNAGDTGDVGLIPGSGKCPRGRSGNWLQFSCLKYFMNRGAWQAIAQRGVNSQTRLSMTKHIPTCPMPCGRVLAFSLDFEFLEGRNGVSLSKESPLGAGWCSIETGACNWTASLNGVAECMDRELGIGMPKAWASQLHSHGKKILNLLLGKMEEQY